MLSFPSHNNWPTTQNLWLVCCLLGFYSDSIYFTMLAMMTIFYLCIPSGSQCKKRSRRCGMLNAWCSNCSLSSQGACCLGNYQSEDCCYQDHHRYTRNHSLALCWNWRETKDKQRRGSEENRTRQLYTAGFVFLSFALENNFFILQRWFHGSEM